MSKRVITGLIILLFSFIGRQSSALSEGDPAPNFVAYDTDGNLWNLHNLLNSGKDVLMIFGKAEDSFLWFQMGAGTMINNSYADYGPDGTDELMIFFIESNPDNAAGAIHGLTTGSAGDWGTMLDVPIIDATASLLADYYDGPSILYSDRIFYGACEQGIIIMQQEFFPPVDYSNYVQDCEGVYDGQDIDVGVHIEDCPYTNSIRITITNVGSVAVDTLGYTLEVNGEQYEMTWTGYLLPLHEIYLFVDSLGNEPIPPNSVTNVSIALSEPDGNAFNNTSSDSATLLIAATDHLRLKIYSPGIYEGIFEYTDMLGCSFALDMDIGPEDDVLDLFLCNSACGTMAISWNAPDSINLAAFSVNEDGSETLIFSLPEQMDDAVQNPNSYWDWSYQCEVAVLTEVTPVITGKVRREIDGFNVPNPLETGIEGIEVHCNGIFTYTDENGEFIFEDIVASDQEVVKIYFDESFWVMGATEENSLGVTNGIISKPVTNHVASGYDFKLMNEGLNQGLSAYVSPPIFICDMPAVQQIAVTNLSNYYVHADLILEVDDGLYLSDASPAYVSISDSTVMWHLDSVAPGDFNYFTANLISPNFEMMGDTIETTAHILTYDTLGVLFSDSTLVFSSILNCSYDPNDKTAIPVGDGPAHGIADSQQLEYLIRFQNTGNYPAQNIRITDTIDVDLDLLSYHLLGASHPVVPVIHFGERVIEFVFDDIQLPDSSTDEAGSQGWVSFSMMPDDDVEPLTLIENTAYIYFDLNPAIITNTCFHTIKDTEVVNGLEDRKEVDYTLYPNPADDLLKMIPFMSDGLAVVEIYDGQGRMVLQTRLAMIPGASLDVGNLTPGVYQIRINPDNENSKAWNGVFVISR